MLTVIVHQGHLIIAHQPVHSQQVRSEVGNTETGIHLHNLYHQRESRQRAPISMNCWVPVTYIRLDTAARGTHIVRLVRTTAA
jgi:hypothetical protein